ncbi:unnamed protein product [Caenorhabditis sp. 36 PRJEB53466]|nr:unnamed protein product [Caenorhabditis sp. 36 PRJEB53466]
MSEQVLASLAKQQDDLWRLFSTNQNEMIVTKGGRKMFPKLEYTVKGLVSEKLYAMMLHIEPADDSRYKFSSGKWEKSGKAEKHVEPKKVWHADGVMTGKQWMSSQICFERVKITNNVEKKSASHIFLHSMHKYIPVLSIYESPSESPFNPQVSTRLVCSVKLPYTEFIAVTAYQNEAVIKLKIQYNPFAKGFREGSQGDRKRTSPSADDSTPEEGCSQVSSPQPKRRMSSASPPIFQPTMFPQPNMFSIFNPNLYSPFLSQLATANLASSPFSFPLGFPCFPLPFQNQVLNMSTQELKEPKKRS